MSSQIKLETNSPYYDFIYLGPTIKIGPKTMKKLLFKCKCGNNKEIYISTITRGQKTCGDCKKILINSGDKYHHFTYIGKTGYLSPNSPKKSLFKCKCGKVKYIRIDSITKESTVRCGLCNIIELNPGDKYHSFIYAGDTVKVHLHGSSKIPFQCKCGKIISLPINQVTTNHRTSCGHCNDFILNHNDKYHGFIYKGETTIISPHSHRKLNFMCKCGNLKKIKFWEISNGVTNTCNQCSEIQLNNGDKYNEFIYIGKSIKISKWDKKKLLFKCKCGQSKNIMLSSITSGNTKTCGSCRKTVYDWYIKNYNVLQLMRAPITTDMIPQGGVIFIAAITNTGLPTPALCPVCGSKYNPRYSDVKRGRSLTCGCVNNRISSINYEISDFIKSIGFKTILEYKLGKYSYDIFIKNTKILIEYDGEKWHNNTYTKDLDLRKSKFAIDHGYQLLRIKEADWKIQSTKIKNQIVKELKTCFNS